MKNQLQFTSKNLFCFEKSSFLRLLAKLFFNLCAEVRHTLALDEINPAGFSVDLVTWILGTLIKSDTYVDTISLVGG